MTLKAKCPCGKMLIVEESEDGQTLYGTMAWKQGVHEAQCNVINNGKQWKWDHGGPKTSPKY